MYHDGTYHMWYSGSRNDSTRIGHSTSPDGITWTKDPDYVMSSSNEWERKLLFAGGTIFDGSAFHMWYSAGAPYQILIGYASSADGSQWEKVSQPVLGKGPEGSWESQYVGGSSVLFDSTKNTFQMWYSGVSTSDEIASIGYAESIKDTTGTLVKGHATPGICIYPNPSNSFLTIETGTSDLYIINITSLNGKLVLSKELEGTTHQIDLSSFQKGVYFITIRSKDFVTTRKVIQL